MTEPKPVVLPLHHDPIALQKYDILFTPASLPALFSTKSTIFLFSSRKRQQKHAHKLSLIGWAQNFRPRLSTPEIEKTTSEVIIFISEVVVFILEVNSSPSYLYFFSHLFLSPFFSIVCVPISTRSRSHAYARVTTLKVLFFSFTAFTESTKLQAVSELPVKEKSLKVVKAVKDRMPFAFTRNLLLLCNLPRRVKA